MKLITSFNALKRGDKVAIKYAFAEYTRFTLGHLIQYKFGFSNKKKRAWMSRETEIQKGRCVPRYVLGEVMVREKRAYYQ